jgi:hypothetical protein
VSLIILSLWGMLGAFNYAGPQLGDGLFNVRVPPVLHIKSLYEFVTALAIGAISAAAFSQWIAGMLHQHDARAVAAATGMLTNAVNKVVIDAVTDHIRKRLLV